MIKDKVYYLKQELQGYTQTELKDVQSYITHLLTSFYQKENVEEALFVLSALREACGKVLLWPEHPNTFSSVLRRKFYEMVESLKVFTETYCPNIKRIQKHGFIVLLLKIRLKTVQKKVDYIGIPISYKSFLGDTTSWEALIDNEFPGYIQNNSLHLLYPKIIRKKRNLYEQ